MYSEKLITIQTKFTTIDIITTKNITRLNPTGWLYIYPQPWAHNIEHKGKGWGKGAQDQFVKKCAVISIKLMVALSILWFALSGNFSWP